MDFSRINLVFYFSLTMGWQCNLQHVNSSSFEEKVELRKALDEVTQAQIVKGDYGNHLYHSYIFKSGIGNREELRIDSVHRDIQFAAGTGMLSWQSTLCEGQVFLLGRGLSSVSLLVTPSQLLPNRSAQFSEHKLVVGTNVTSTVLFTRWNVLLSEEEVICAVALNSVEAEILWFRVVANKLVMVTRWFRYKQTGTMAVVKGETKDQLVITDASSPTSVDVFDIMFTADGNNLNLRWVQNFTLENECSSVVLCRVARQTYLIFTQPSQHSVAVYKMLTVAKFSFFKHYTTLTFPRLSQIVTFSLAGQVYLALNGDKAYVFRISHTGHLVEELSLGFVNKWVAVPVTSYRSDVVLLSQNASQTNAYVWGGTNKGFVSTAMPECERCLEGDWSGAASIQLGHRNCLILPRVGKTSSLVHIATSLHNTKNPISEHIDSVAESMKQYEERLNNIQSRLMEAEELLKHIIKVDGENIITAKWKVGRVLTHELTLSSMVTPKSEVRSTSEPISTSRIDVSTLTDLVEETSRSAKQLQEDVVQKGKKVWGLERYSGKLSIKGRLIVDNLTVVSLNGHSMDDILQNTYRKDKPQVIKVRTVIHSLQVDNLYFGKIKNESKESIKFSDELVVLKGNVSFLCPLTIQQDLKLEPGSRVNGLNLSKELCQEEKHCAVFSNVGAECYNSYNMSNPKWTHAIAGKNLTVKKINGLNWDNLIENVVYLDHYQQIPGTTIIKGSIYSDGPVLVGNVEKKYSPQQRNANNSLKMSASSSKKSPVSAEKKIEEEVWLIDPYSNVVFTDLEVTGSVICNESEWGQSASDVVLSDANPVHIYGDKVFQSDVNIANNMDVKGSFGGVNLSELITIDTPQVFTDFTVLQGNITLGNLTVSGSWNGVNISNSTTGEKGFSIDPEFMREITADRVRVTETLNGVPVNQLVFTDDNGVTTVKELFAQSLTVVGQINVDGKVSNQDLKDFAKRRLSIREEQIISGHFVFDNVSVSNGFELETLNDMDMLDLEIFPKINEIHLSALHVDGNITTDFGLNGYNLTEVAEHSVWLQSNNIITGHLIFKDDVTFDRLDCQGFFNQKLCQQVFDFKDVVFKTNETIVFSGEKIFLNSLNIVEDVNIEKINEHKVESILTKTTKQKIEGNVVLHGNVSTIEEFVLKGLLNNQNLTDITSRCTLSGNTIRCTGNAEFEDSIELDHLTCMGTVNGINFTHFLESLVDVKNPQPITGFKTFSGKISVENLDVDKINNISWDAFLLNTVKQNSNEAVEPTITFKEKVTAHELSVDFDLEADSINGVDLNEWCTNAIYLNDSFTLNRTLHLSSASSAGNITIVMYGEVNMGVDLIRLHTPNIIDHLSFESVTVLNRSDIGETMNGHNFSDEKWKTLEISGNQVVLSDLIISGEVLISGNVTIPGEVNNYNLSDLVTLDTDQHLNGNYNFKCVNATQNVTSSGLMSGINMSEWKETAVLDKGQQDITGVWTVLGSVEFKGPVLGKGRLGGVNLVQLKDNITRDISNVHRDLKANLTTACEETNNLIHQARNQTSEFMSLDLTQEIEVPVEVSLVTHFKDKNGDYLTVSDKQCTTTVYKWDKFNGSYSILFTKGMGFKVSQLGALHQDQLTYLVSVSSDLSMDCYFSGKHIWLFTQDTIKHISIVDLGQIYTIEVYGNELYSMNATGVFKWTMQFINNGVNFQMVQMWAESTAGKNFIPEEAGLGLALYNTNQIISLEPDFPLSSGVFQNWTGDLLSVSVSPTRQFIAIATSEKTQVPRYSDHVKIYDTTGSLFDKIPAQRASHLHWFPVPDQTWLVYEQNHTSINLYQLQGIFEGFQLRFSANIEDITSLSTLTLPVASKVNLQPYLIVQTSTSVKILHTILQGDVYLGPDLPCTFNDTLQPVPSQ